MRNVADPSNNIFRIPHLLAVKGNTVGTIISVAAIIRVASLSAAFLQYSKMKFFFSICIVNFSIFCT
jgi:hypothetical protein